MFSPTLYCSSGFLALVGNRSPLLFSRHKHAECITIHETVAQYWKKFNYFWKLWASSTSFGIVRLCSEPLAEFTGIAWRRQVARALRRPTASLDSTLRGRLNSRSRDDGSLRYCSHLKAAHPENPSDKLPVCPRVPPSSSPWDVAKSGGPHHWSPCMRLPTMAGAWVTFLWYESGGTARLGVLPETPQNLPRGRSGPSSCR
jgi:hypothetical protein